VGSIYVSTVHINDYNEWTYSSGIRSALLAFVLDPSPRVGNLLNAPDEKLADERFATPLMMISTHGWKKRSVIFRNDDSG
jgi:hypothetical protein